MTDVSSTEPTSRALYHKETRLVSKYLEALAKSMSPRRGRPQTVESVTIFLEKVKAQINDAPPMEKLMLIQRKLGYEQALRDLQNIPSLDVLEAGFVSVAKSWAQRQGITADALREFGVPPQVLAKVYA